MSSPLASRFLSAVDVADMGDFFWENADYTLVKAPITKITLAQAESIIESLHSLEIEAFASVINDPEVISALYASHPSVQLARGLARNPVTSKATLKDIKSSKAAGAADAAERLDAVKTFKKAVQKGKKGAIELSIDTLRTLNVVQPVVEMLEGDDADIVLAGLAIIVQKRVDADDKNLEAEVKRLGDLHLERLAYRKSVLEAFKNTDIDLYDGAMYQLLGLGETPIKAASVDTYIASWLCDSESVYAGGARASLVPEGGARRSQTAGEFSGRLSSAARELFKKHDDLWDVVAYKVADVGVREVPYGHGSPLSLEQASSMRMIGLTGDDLSGQVFSSHFTATPDEMQYLLEGISPNRLASFFKGEELRKPRPGDVTALVTEMDTKEIALLLAEFKDFDFATVPWAPELSIALPGMLQKEDLPAESLQRIYASAVEVLGDDKIVWADFLRISEHFPGSLLELTEGFDD